MTLEGFAMDFTPRLGTETTDSHDFVTFAQIGRSRVIGWLLGSVENDVEEDWLSKLEREVEEAHHLDEKQSSLVVD